MEKKIEPTSDASSKSDVLAAKKPKSRSLNLALTGMLAGVYAVFTLSLGPLSFGVINLRLSNILIGIVPILGWPSVFGIALGVFLGNVLGSNLGPLDYLVSPLLSLVGLTAIYLLRKKSVLAGLTVYSVILSAWVTFELSFVAHFPFFPQFYIVFSGITFVVLVLGYVTYRTLIALGLQKRIARVVGKS